MMHHGARNGGQSTYVLRHGSEGQSAAIHLAELLFSIATNTDLYCIGAEFPTGILIITDSGPHEAPSKESSKWAYSFVRYLLSLRFISVCSYAPGDSAFDPAERPHAALSYALSGSPIGFAQPGQEALALHATKERIGDARFCGREIKSSILLPGQYLEYLPENVVAFLSPSISAAEKRRISSLPIILPPRLLEVRRRVCPTSPALPQITFGGLLDCSTRCSSVSRFCVDLVSCGCPCCGGIPRGGVLDENQRRALLLWPVPSLANEGHYLTYAECMSLPASDKINFSTPDHHNPLLILKDAVAKKGGGVAELSPALFVAAFQPDEIGSLAKACLLTDVQVRDSLLHIQTVKVNRKAGALTAAKTRQSKRK